jgi:hypothetical protein
MKNYLLAAACLLAFTFAACTATETKTSSTSDSTAAHADSTMVAAVWQCPMKCEGDKTYAEAGKCPVCGMDLEKIN